MKRVLKLPKTAAVVAGLAIFALSLQAAIAGTIQIRVLNAKNGNPVPHQRVTVAVKGVKNATEYTTDAEGNINVNLDPGDEIFVATEWWTTCRKMKSGVDPYVPVRTILEEGVTVPNACGRPNEETIRGKLIIFAKKSSIIKLFQK